MSVHVHAVLEQAKRLTPDERLELARELLASVDEDEETATPEEIAAAWDDEIRARDEQVLAGKGGAHDAEDVLAGPIASRARNSSAGAVAKPKTESPELTQDEVRAVLERTRR